MERLSIPFLLLGPSGSGKLSQVRRWVETAHKCKIALPLESRTFSVGDGYEARVLASPYHFEIDIPNLSMQDKQIIGDLLTTFFSSGDVLSSLRTSTRKLVILRRAHSLSLPAAIRVRSIVQQFILPADASGMLWLTAREMTGPLAILADAFVMYRVPRMSLAAWSADTTIPEHLRTPIAWEKCEGRVDRAHAYASFFPAVAEGAELKFPRRICDFYDEMVELIIQHGRSGIKPNLNVVSWIRGRVYQALSFCQTGPEIVDSCAAAIQRKAELLEPEVFFKVMSSLTMAEPHTSYRTALSLESAILNMFEIIHKYSSVVPLPDKKTAPSNDVGTSAAIGDEPAKPAAPAVTKTTVKRRAPPRKQGSKE